MPRCQALNPALHHRAPNPCHARPRRARPRRAHAPASRAPPRRAQTGARPATHGPDRSHQLRERRSAPNHARNDARTTPPRARISSPSRAPTSPSGQARLFFLKRVRTTIPISPRTRDIAPEQAHPLKSRPSIDVSLRHFDKHVTRVVFSSFPPRARWEHTPLHPHIHAHRVFDRKPL